MQGDGFCDGEIKEAGGTNRCWGMRRSRVSLRGLDFALQALRTFEQLHME